MSKHVEVIAKDPTGGVFRDKYAEAVAWEVTERGDLMVLRGGAAAEASYPFGQWVRVRWAS